MSTLRRLATTAHPDLVREYRWELRAGFFLIGGLAAHLLGA